jgi:hypothetical protein
VEFSKLGATGDGDAADVIVVTDNAAGVVVLLTLLSHTMQAISIAASSANNEAFFDIIQFNRRQCCTSGSA